MAQNRKPQPSEGGNVVARQMGAWVAVLVLAAVALPAHSVGADSVDCGRTIRHDTVLQHDLAGCRGTGLFIGADGVTPDLNGHTVGGTFAEGTTGIRIRPRGGDHPQREHLGARRRPGTGSSD